MKRINKLMVLIYNLRGFYENQYSSNAAHLLVIGYPY